MTPALLTGTSEVGAPPRPPTAVTASTHSPQGKQYGAGGQKTGFSFLFFLIFFLFAFSPPTKRWY